MTQRQFRSDDTSLWNDRFGTGSDGALTISANTTDSTANTTITGTSGATAATFGSGTGFANGNLVLIHQSQGTGAGSWELNKISSGGGTTSVTLAYSLCNTYATGAQVYLLKQYSSVTINSGVTLTGAAWAGSTGGIVALLCNGTITVTGTITTSQKGFRGGNNWNGVREGHQGEGTVGVGSNVYYQGGANGNGGGAGSENAGSPSTSGGGGGGGNATAGANGTGSNIGNGGNAVGLAGLTTLFFGGGGGQGGGQNATPGAGGNGGGIIILIGKTITVTGAVSTSGANGVRPGVTDGAGGGGAGGSVLLKGQTITLGTTLVTGTAGSGGTATGAGAGGNGSVGRIHADYSTSLSGTTSPTIDTSLDSSLADPAGGAAFFALF